MRVAIFGNNYQSPERIKGITDILINNKVEVFMHDELYNYLVLQHQLSLGKVTCFSNCSGINFDFAITIGGDGTFLRTAAIIGDRNIPMLGVNTGRLGFLADTTEADLDRTLTDILAGRYKTVELDQLQLTTEINNFEGYNQALNEIAILKQDTSSMITIHAYINSEFLTSYEADGLIVSTPTGSTAYSLSVGGPIMTPTTASLILTAVAPHSLSTRPLVVDNDSIITLDIESRNNAFLVSLDGRSATFSADTRLTIRKAKNTIKVIKQLEHSFYNTLRKKLNWGIDPRQK